MTEAEGKRELASLSLDELKELMEGMGEKSFRGEQIFTWIHQKNIKSIEEMTNISGTLKEKLRKDFFLASPKEAECLISKRDGTRKYLFRLYDGNVIESVLMKYHHGNSVCISSQAGCRMGCRFCASTLLGLSRNLYAGEMLGQIYAIERETGERISNVVVMGTGEPLDNYDELICFISNLSHPLGHKISQRNITVSTCGLADEINRLAKEGFSITLALSLHAPNDGLRRKIMPVTDKYPIKDVISACDDYFLKTGRRITYEYSLMKGINDSREHAVELAGLLKGKNCHVNLIPVNPVSERGFEKTSSKDVERFKIILEKNRINVTIRRGMGSDINAACGQLRLKFENNFSNPADAGRNASHSAIYEEDRPVQNQAEPDEQHISAGSSLSPAQGRRNGR